MFQQFLTNKCSQWNDVFKKSYWIDVFIAVKNLRNNTVLNSLVIVINKETLEFNIMSKEKVHYFE